MSQYLPSGYMRLWLIVSCAWSLGVIVDLAAVKLVVDQAPINPFVDLAASPSLAVECLRMGMLIFGPPLMLLAIGFAIRRFGLNSTI